MRAIGTLRIYMYTDREGRFYKMTYFNGRYYFVHLPKRVISNCVWKISKTNKKYLEYSGEFNISQNVIDIY